MLAVHFKWRLLNLDDTNQIPHMIFMKLPFTIMKVFV